MKSMDTKTSDNATSNIFTRMKKVLSSDDFIKEEVIPQNSLKPSFKFWFGWNAIFALVFAAISTVMMLQQLDLFKITTWEEKVPDFQAEIVDGKFSTNLETPYVLTTQNSKNDILRIDFSEDLNLNKTLIKIKEGLLITKDTAYIRDNYSTQTFEFSKLTNDFSTSKQEISSKYEQYKPQIFTGYFTITFLAVMLITSSILLIIALFWAIIFWSIGGLIKVKDWSFSKSLAAVLHFLILPIWFLAFFGLFFQKDIDYLIIITLGILFYLNLSKLRPRKTNK